MISPPEATHPRSTSTPFAIGYVLQAHKRQLLTHYPSPSTSLRQPAFLVSANPHCRDIRPPFQPNQKPIYQTQPTVGKGGARWYDDRDGGGEEAVRMGPYLNPGNKMFQRALGGECVLVGVTYDEATCEHSCEIERTGMWRPVGRAP